MTAQTPERIIVCGSPQQLFADPLYRLRKHYRLDLSNPHGASTANYRGYVGTWEIKNGHLYLLCLCWDGGMNGEISIPEELRHRLLRAASAVAFPIYAHWFTGVVRIALGRRLVYSHQGWSHWFESERVVHIQGGTIRRDREVDTRAILEWWLRRNPEAANRLDPSKSGPLGPLTWFDDEEDDWLADWWPPDLARNR